MPVSTKCREAAQLRSSRRAAACTCCVKCVGFSQGIFFPCVQECRISRARQCCDGAIIFFVISLTHWSKMARSKGCVYNTKRALLPITLLACHTQYVKVETLRHSCKSYISYRRSNAETDGATAPALPEQQSSPSPTWSCYCRARQHSNHSQCKHCHCGAEASPQHSTGQDTRHEASHRRIPDQPCPALTCPLPTGEKRRHSTGHDAGHEAKQSQGI